jgi:hypothetical protein
MFRRKRNNNSGGKMRPEVELKDQMRLAGVQVLEVCERIKRPYGTVAGWLNGFAPLPDNVRREIMKMIEEKRADQKQGHLKQ